jgi:hypothetical protein
VFALFLDLNTGITFIFLAESRGQAGVALQAYIQRYGKPNEVVHDNATEFKQGDFAQICLNQQITQTPSPPYEPNKNPVELYMDIIISMGRSLLYVSGLNPDTFWDSALGHAVQIQNRTALTGRATPYELTCERRPNVSNLRIFGCEALCYVEKDKRTKLQPKVERAIYLGLSPDHSNDTYKLLRIGTNSIIYRWNVYFNERSFPARKFKLPPTLTSPDDSHELIGLEFEDDNERWTITKVGFHDDHPVLYYINNKTGEEERSSVNEVRTWYHRDRK